MVYDASKLIQSGDFCQVVSDKFVHEAVKRNHIVYIAGHRIFPVSEEDPYTQRVKFLVRLMKDGHIDKEDQRLFLMDPVSLAKVSTTKQKKLDATLTEDYPQEQTEPEAEVATIN